MAEIKDVTGYLDPSNPLSGLVGTQIEGKDVWSAYQTAQHIARFKTTWADGDDDLIVTYHFITDAVNAEGESYTFSEGQMATARIVYDLAADISGLTLGRGCR